MTTDTHEPKLLVSSSECGMSNPIDNTSSGTSESAFRSELDNLGLTPPGAAALVVFGGVTVKPIRNVSSPLDIANAFYAAAQVSAELGRDPKEPGTARLAHALSTGPAQAKYGGAGAGDDGSPAMLPERGRLLPESDITNDEFAVVRRLATEAVGGRALGWEVLRNRLNSLLFARLRDGANAALDDVLGLVGAKKKLGPKADPIIREDDAEPFDGDAGGMIGGGR